MTLSRQRLGRWTWGRDLPAGLLLGLVSFAYSLSFGALVFSGELAPYADAGVTAAALSAGVASLALSRLSSFPRALGGPDTPVIAVASALTAAAAAASAEGLALVNAAAALTAAAAATGLLLLVAGLRGWASYVRFIPYPVVAGFLAASGWFLASGALSIAVGTPAGLALEAMARGGPPPPVLATAGVALTIWAARRATGSSLTAPAVVVLAGGAAALAPALGLVDPAALRAEGWLLPEVSGAGPALPLLALSTAAPEPGVLLRLAPEILSVSGVAAVAILLNAAGLEAHARADLDADREFAASGAANVLVAVFGGLASNLSLNRSALNVDLGAVGRTSGAVAGLVVLGLAALGPAAGAAIPAPVLGGLVLYMGATMLWRWLGGAAARGFGLWEWLLVLAIFGAIVRFGYLEGVALGVTAACVSFAVACARAPFLKQAMSRRDYASYVDRPAEEETRLREAGGRIRIWRLQGFLFFGVSSRIADRVKAAIEDAKAEGAPLSSAILDFRGVTGADSTVRFAFARLGELAEAEGVALIFTGLSGEGRRSRALGAAAGSGVAETFPTLELGLEAAEERLLDALGDRRRDRTGVLDWLSAAMDDACAAEAVTARLERRDAAAGSRICAQGAPSDAMFFVAAGRVSIFLEPAGRPALRLRTALGRTVIGEIGFFTGAPRSASVYADEPSEVWAMTADGFTALKAEAPAAALALEGLVIRVLADRLTFANREVAALQ